MSNVNPKLMNLAQDLVASAHGIYRGGLGVHLAMKTMAGHLGLEVDLTAIPNEDITRNDVALYSESAGRFIVTIDPHNQAVFENHFSRLPVACIGRVTGDGRLRIKGKNDRTIVDLTVPALKDAWQKTFGNLL